ncbi:PPR domain-containing protein/PPR_2 domain-containing protein, partial [Cephalotus follicularis]
ITATILCRFSSITEPRVLTNNNNDDGENPPNPIRNSPLRGEAPPNSYTPLNQKVQTSYSQSSRPDFIDKKGGDDTPQSDHDFLQKFKLGLDNKETKAKTELPQQQVLTQKSPEDADEIFKKMKETGLIPNAVAMLDGLCKDGLVQEAMKLFGLMREKGTIPEVVIYTAVVDGYCKAHKLDDAKRIFRKMQTNGITPNAFTYGVLIQGLCKCNKLADAVQFSVEMLEAGHSPNVTTFVGLVDGICKDKGVEEAQSVITKLRQKGFFINDKAIRDFLNKKAPFSPLIWEAIFGKKTSQRSF